MSKVNKAKAKAVLDTAIYSVFIITTGFAALALRGNITLQPWAEQVIGTVLAAITLFTFITIVYKANKK